jgi:hypothetical protein
VFVEVLSLLRVEVPDEVLAVLFVDALRVVVVAGLALPELLVAEELLLLTAGGVAELLVDDELLFVPPDDERVVVVLPLLLRVEVLLFIVSLLRVADVEELLPADELLVEFVLSGVETAEREVPAERLVPSERDSTELEFLNTSGRYTLTERLLTAERPARFALSKRRTVTSRPVALR